VAHIVVQDRRRNRSGLRPDLGLLSRPLAAPQPRHPAMRKVTPPVPHRADVHPENCGDLLGLPPLQRQQDRSRPVRFAAMLRFRQGAQCRLFRSISRELRFSRHACLHSPHPRQTFHSIAHSQAVCLVDFSSLTLASRIDVYPGESELLDIVMRADNDEECYGWNNEAYFSTPPWRNPNWKLPHGRYLIQITVTSSGQKCVRGFRLINDVSRKDFRLEGLNAGDAKLLRGSR
jgi:hypothetical protein